eukprot:3900365-Amphidinium_carterae.1
MVVWRICNTAHCRALCLVNVRASSDFDHQAQPGELLAAKQRHQTRCKVSRGVVKELRLLME